MNIHFSGLFFAGAMVAITLSSCQEQASGPLPILGNRTVVNGDTLYPVVPDFEFVNQDSQLVTQETFKDKVYVVDFFFIHCPTICPKVKANGLRVYNKYLDDDRVVLLSHSIDVRNDTVAALRRHADKLGIETRRWHLVTGDEDAIYRIADDYFSVAVKNPEAPGGFDHSGRLILVDKQKHVRAFCDGTNNEDVDRFMKDIDRLLDEH